MLNEQIYKVQVAYNGVDWAEIHGLFMELCMESGVESAGLLLTDDDLSGELTASSEADLDYLRDNLVEFIKYHASSWE